MGSHPRPHFFISRPDHTITPLIAVDELPDYIRIHGVSALMSQADTQAMMSLGVKERSIGHYDVQLVKSSSSSSSSSYEEPTKPTNASGIDPISSGSDKENNLTAPGKQTEHIEEATIDSSSIEVIQRPDLMNGEEKTAITSKDGRDGPGDPKPVDVEEWRKKVDVDETQAKIDALVAASAQNSNEIKETPSGEIPHADRENARITPGKKVYCSHWIRTGECDFTQQGCIYKHKMPDDDTLKTIGIRSLPTWYAAAHPEEARERGFGRGNTSGSRAWGARGNQLSAASLTRSQPPAFNPRQAFGFPGNPDETYFGAPAVVSSRFARPPFAPHTDQYHGYGRIQELADQPLPQYNFGARSNGKELQIMRKPPKPKTPGFKTCPFQLPPPTSAVSPPPEKPPAPHVPVWDARPSKMSNEYAHRQEQSRLASKKARAATQGPSGTSTPLKPDTAKVNNSAPPATTTTTATATATSVNPRTTAAVMNAAYPSLQPTSPPQSSLAALPPSERKASISSDIFDLAPKTPSHPHRRLFVPPGEARYVTAAEEPIAVREGGPTAVKDKADTPPRHEKPEKRHRKERVAPSRNERPKNHADNDSKKRVVSPEKTRRGKQAERECGQPTELLVDIDG